MPRVSSSVLDQSSKLQPTTQGSYSLTNSGINAGSNNLASNVGPPPEAYMANLIAKELMRSGASMYGRKEDATCVLRVGTGRYYVHVQLLAARSPAFRRIFDDMIRSNAWGPSPTDAETSAADTYSQSHEQDYEDDHELMDTEGCSMTSMTSYGESQCLSESTGMGRRQSCEADFQHSNTGSCFSPSISYQERNGYFEVELASDSNDMPLIPTIHPSIDQLNVDVRRSARDQGAERDNGEGGGDNAADMDDSEDYLPELTVSFTDPEKGRFEEILYWLYTGDDRRWLSYFTPENYETILQIILELRIVTKSVLDICLAFETMTSPEQGLRGKAHDVFFGPDGNTTYAVPTGSHWRPASSSPHFPRFLPRVDC